jgi:hypothetical protein
VKIALLSLAFTFGCLAASAASCASMARRGVHRPSPTQPAFDCFGILITNWPAASPSFNA